MVGQLWGVHANLAIKTLIRLKQVSMVYALIERFCMSRARSIIANGDDAHHLFDGGLGGPGCSSKDVLDLSNMLRHDYMG